MWSKKWLLFTIYGFLIAIAVSNALKATRPKFKIASSTTTSTLTSTLSEESFIEKDLNNESEITTISMIDSNTTTGHTLTGIPQIDYIWDPNLPRELNGYNLSDYPFYSSMPEDIDFKCDGLHDGFYASVPHKCQVYHHCLFGTRYDFLCANFTAFDQKTFICHFVSEVDCANSKKYWHRNDALYKAATTSTSTTSTTSTTTTLSSIDKTNRPPTRERDLPVRRRRPSVRRPAYDYYYEDYYEDDYDRTRSRGYNRRDYDDYEDRKYRRDRDRDIEYRHRGFRDRDRNRYLSRVNRRDPSRAKDTIEEESVRPKVKDQDISKTNDEEDSVKVNKEKKFPDKRNNDDKDLSSSTNMSNHESLVKTIAPLTSVYSRQRMPSIIRRPVPLSEQDKYSYAVGTTVRSQSEIRRQPVHDESEQPQRRPVEDSAGVARGRPLLHTEDNSQRRPTDVLDDIDDYYDEEIEEVRPRWLMRSRPMRDRDVLLKRYRDRPYSIRYRDDEEISHRRKPERLRDRLPERDRDRSLTRNRDHSFDYVRDRDSNYDRYPDTIQENIKLEKIPSHDQLNHRDHENVRSRNPGHNNRQGIIESSKKNISIGRITTQKSTAIVIKALKKEEFQYPMEEKNDRLRNPSFKSDYNHQHKNDQNHKIYENSDEKELSQHFSLSPGISNSEKEESSSDFLTDYYDDIEDSTMISVSTPRFTNISAHIIKRPFLPSRGGNPNPRGLSKVGNKASLMSRHNENPIKQFSQPHGIVSSYVAKNKNGESDTNDKDKHPQKHQKNNQQFSIIQLSLQIEKNYDKPDVKTNLQNSSSLKKPKLQESLVQSRTENKEITDFGVNESKETDRNIDQHSKSHNQENDYSNFQSSINKNDKDERKFSINGNTKITQTINEVTHHNLQDIPENEYDVTLNDALTPNLNHESSFPSGFILPLHRQFNLHGRDTILQSSDNLYKFSKPIDQQDSFQQKQKTQQVQQKHSHLLRQNNQFIRSFENEKGVDKEKIS